MSKILVLNSTGKVGGGVTLALKNKGFEVFGTTRGGKSVEKLTSQGIQPVICDYNDKLSLESAFKTTGAKHAFLITDFFLAAKSNSQKEIDQGKAQIDAAKAAGCEFVIYSSAADCDKMSEKVKHIKTKAVIEDYLKSSGLKFAILRPVAFFENYNDNANWNPLNKGHVKFLSSATVKFCATADIGKAASVIFSNPDAWNGKTLDVASWEGDGHEVARALTNVSGTPTKFSLAMPIFFRKLFLNDLHHMCKYFEKSGGFTSSIEEFKKVVPDGMSAEDWFRSVGKYHNGVNFLL